MTAIALGIAVVSGCGGSPNDDSASASDSVTTITVHPDDEAIAAGYVAKCNDGNHSDNHDFGATCSGGDGIDYWLSTFGRCSDGTVIEMTSSASCPDGASFAGLLAPDYTTTTSTTVTTTSTTTVTVPIEVAVPDLLGTPLDDAALVLADVDLDHSAADVVEDRMIIVRGNWLVVEQAPVAGTVVDAGTSVELGVARPSEVGSTDGSNLTPERLEAALAAASGHETLLDACSDGSPFCFISDISTSSGFATIRVQISERDEQFGEQVATNIFTFVGLEFPELRWIVVNNARGEVIATVQRSSVLRDQ